MAFSATKMRKKGDTAGENVVAVSFLSFLGKLT